MDIGTPFVPLLHFGRKQIAKKFVVIAPHLRVDLRGIARLPTPILHPFKNLIVAAPHSKAGVIAQTLYVVVGLFGDALQKRRIGRISSAGKHKILPHQYAVLVGKIIETVVFVSPAAPDAYHIHICLLDGPEERSIPLICHRGQRHVGRYVV